MLSFDQNRIFSVAEWSNENFSSKHSVCHGPLTEKISAQSQSFVEYFINTANRIQTNRIKMKPGASEK